MTSVWITRQCGCKQGFTVIGSEVREELRPCATHAAQPEYLPPSLPSGRPRLPRRGRRGLTGRPPGTRRTAFVTVARARREPPGPFGRQLGREQQQGRP